MIKKIAFGLGVLTAGGALLVALSWYLDAAEERARTHWQQQWDMAHDAPFVQRDPFATV